MIIDLCYLLRTIPLMHSINCFKFKMRLSISLQSTVKSVAPTVEGSERYDPTNWLAVLHTSPARLCVIVASGNGGLLWAIENFVHSWDKALDISNMLELNSFKSSWERSVSFPVFQNTLKWSFGKWEVI